MRSFMCLILFCFSIYVLGGEKINAVIDGDTYFGVAGARATISLYGESCVVYSESDGGIENFKILFSCGERQQVLWDINQLSPEGIGFDDPKFSLLWAGDVDNDKKVDIVMDMSPKYSCTRKMTLWSTLAKSEELLGIKGKPIFECY